MERMRCEDWQTLAFFNCFLPFLFFCRLNRFLWFSRPAAQAVALHLEQTKNQQPPNPEVETFLAQSLGYSLVTSSYVFAQKDQ